MVKQVMMYQAADGSLHASRDAAERAERSEIEKEARDAVYEALQGIRLDPAFDGWFEDEYGHDLHDVTRVVMACGAKLFPALRIAFGPRAAED